jgi:hypothetical protein
LAECDTFIPFTRFHPQAHTQKILLRLDRLFFWGYVVMQAFSRLDPLESWSAGRIAWQNCRPTRRSMLVILCDVLH